MSQAAAIGHVAHGCLGHLDSGIDPILKSFSSAWLVSRLAFLPNAVLELKRHAGDSYLSTVSSALLFDTDYWCLSAMNCLYFRYEKPHHSMVIFTYCLPCNKH